MNILTKAALLVSIASVLSAYPNFKFYKQLKNYNRLVGHGLKDSADINTQPVIGIIT